MISFNQDKVDWYRWSKNKKKIQSWDDFKNMVKDWFRISMEGTVLSRLWNLKTESLEAEYQKQF